MLRKGRVPIHVSANSRLGAANAHRDCHVGNDGAWAIAGALSISSVTALDLRYGRAVMFVKRSASFSPRFPTSLCFLHSAARSESRIGSAGARSLVLALRNSSVIELNLGYGDRARRSRACVDESTFAVCV